MSTPAHKKFTITLALAATVLLASASAASAGPTAATASVDAKASASSPSAFKLTANGAYSYHGKRYVLPRTLLDLRGAVKADLSGQSVVVVISRGGKVVKRKSVELNESDGKAIFHFKWRTGNKGRYSVKIDLTEAQSAIASRGGGTKVSVVRTNIHYGSRGVAVRLFQHELRQLAYVAPLNGRFDAATGRALIAYRKVLGMARRPSAGYGIARRLAEGKGTFHLRYPGAGRHVEVSIRKQVMAFASGGKVVRIYHVSTGAPATPTVRGTYRVYRKDWGTNQKGMVDSSYFTGGYAIHGYAEVPTYNASHGCVRVPVPNAASIYAWVHMGTRVDTYY
ncbi:MAG: L,D-transpeptidase [Solirubrobacterales bacterium]